MVCMRVSSMLALKERKEGRNWLISLLESPRGQQGVDRYDDEASTAAARIDTRTHKKHIHTMSRTNERLPPSARGCEKAELFAQKATIE